MNNTKVKEDYKGSYDEKGLPSGKGVKTSYWDEKIRMIEDGIWQDGFLVEGSETVFLIESAFTIRKEVGKWRYDKEKNICDEFISGEGEELYYKNEEDLQKNKPLGYVKGLFKDGILIKGEVENASLIEYSAMKGIKKIIYNGYVGWSKNVHGEDTQIQKGEIYYEDGFVYKGEISFDLPHGKGTGTHKDGNSHTGNWFNGNLEDKLN
jgi:uncharacterized protein YcnI